MNPFSNLSRYYTTVLCCAALALFPVVVAAQATDLPAPVAGIPWPMIAGILSSVIGVLVAIKQWLPAGTHTIVNGIIGIGGQVAASLAGLPLGASLAMAVTSLVGIAVARFRTKDGGWAL